MLDAMAFLPRLVAEDVVAAIGGDEEAKWRVFAGTAEHVPIAELAIEERAAFEQARDVGYVVVVGGVWCLVNAWKAWCEALGMPRVCVREFGACASVTFDASAMGGPGPGVMEAAVLLLGRVSRAVSWSPDGWVGGERIALGQAAATAKALRALGSPPPDPPLYPGRDGTEYCLLTLEGREDEAAAVYEPVR